MKPEARLFPLCVCERDELTLSAHFSLQKNLIYFLLKKSLNFIIKPAQSTTDININCNFCSPLLKWREERHI